MSLWPRGWVAILVFLVTPWAWSAPLSIEIRGVDKAQEQNARAMLSISALDGKDVSSASRLRYLHRKVEAEIAKAMQPFGYYTIAVEAELDETEQGWRAVYDVTLGEPVLIDSVDIQLIGDAQSDEAFAQVLAKHPLSSGQPLLHSQYEALKQALSSLAAERGYFQAGFDEHRVEVDRDARTAAVILHFNSGPRFTVGDIHFSETPLATSFLERFIPFEQGSGIDSGKLFALQTALTDSDYFQRVEVKPLWQDAEGAAVPIQVYLEPRKQHYYQAGFGFGTDTGARVKLGVTRRWVNQYGHQLSGELLASQIRNDFSAQYTIPGEIPQKDRYVLELGYNDEHSDSIDAESTYIGASWHQQRDDWQIIMATRFQQETATFDGVEEDTQFLIPRLSVTQVQAGDRLNVKQGFRLNAQVSGASKALLSDTDFVQLRLSAKAVHSFTERWRVLGRVDSGITWVDDFRKLPASVRFFAGGDNSIRGFGFESIGPTGRNGDVVGAPHLLTGSLETDYRFKPDWAVAAFIDAGDAFEDNAMQMNVGVGVGLRWFSPIGPVRLDLAVPQTGDEHDLRIHFTLGADL